MRKILSSNFCKASLLQKPKRSKSRFFTLLEVLIALFLIGILLVSLFRFFSETLSAEKLLEKGEKELLTSQKLQLRFTHLFSQILPPSSLKEESVLYTEKEADSSSLSLNFIFDNGIDPDPDFSGATRAKLILTQQKKLLLFLHPLEKKNQKFRKELLKESVESLCFHFIGKKNESCSQSEEKIFSPFLAQYLLWPKERKELPSLLYVDLFISSSQRPLRFAFFPLSSSFPILYEKEELSHSERSL